MTEQRRVHLYFFFFGRAAAMEWVGMATVAKHSNRNEVAQRDDVLQYAIVGVDCVGNYEMCTEWV